MAERHLPVFVYGYLKRGGPGHHLVADSLEEVREATATGRKVDTGADYPGFVFTDGGEAIPGELLFLKTGDFEEVIRKLDDYEQTEAPDLYTRIITEVRWGDEMVESYVYEFTGAAH